MEQTFGSLGTGKRGKGKKRLARGESSLSFGHLQIKVVAFFKFPLGLSHEMDLAFDDMYG